MKLGDTFIGTADLTAAVCLEVEGSLGLLIVGATSEPGRGRDQGVAEGEPWIPHRDRDPRRQRRPRSSTEQEAVRLVARGRGPAFFHPISSGPGQRCRGSVTATIWAGRSPACRARACRHLRRLHRRGRGRAPRRCSSRDAHTGSSPASTAGSSATGPTARRSAAVVGGRPLARSPATSPPDGSGCGLHRGRRHASRRVIEQAGRGLRRAGPAWPSARCGSSLRTTPRSATRSSYLDETSASLFEGDVGAAATTGGSSPATRSPAMLCAGPASTRPRPPNQHPRFCVRSSTGG